MVLGDVEAVVPFAPLARGSFSRRGCGVRERDQPILIGGITRPMTTKNSGLPVRNGAVRRLSKHDVRAFGNGVAGLPRGVSSILG